MRALATCELQFLNKEPRWETAGALALRVISVMVRPDSSVALCARLWRGDIAAGFSGLSSLVQFGDEPPALVAWKGNAGHVTAFAAKDDLTVLKSKLEALGVEEAC